jgi:hypothetical protein
LGGRLVAVVRETVQPEHASLWLRDPGRAEERKDEAKCEKIRERKGPVTLFVTFERR